MMPPRLYQFDGTDNDYIKFLEDVVVKFKEHHSSCSVRPLDVLPQPYAVKPNAETTGCSQLSSIGKRKRSPEQYQIIHWDPPRSVTAEANTSGSRWKQDAQKLIRATPNAEDWTKAVQKADLCGIIGTEQAASYLLDQGTALSPVSVTTTLQDRSLALLDRIRSYAISTSRRKASASTLVKLAAFQQFLLLSACVVLRATKTATDSSVVEIVKICIGDRDKRYCRRVLDAVLYVNRLVDSLSAQGWGDRAAELVMLCESVIALSEASY